MESAIKELYYNESGYFETVETSKEQEQFDTIFKELLNTATEEQKALLNELYVKCDSIQSELGETHFIKGFKLGFRLAAESLK